MQTLYQKDRNFMYIPESVQLSRYKRIVIRLRHFVSYLIALLYIRQHQERRCDPGNHPQE